MIRRLLCALILAAAFPAGAWSTTLHATLRSFSSFSRITVQMPAGLTLGIHRRSDTLSLESSPPVASITSSGHARLILGSAATHAGLDLQLAPGASVRSFRTGSSEVVDVYAPKTSQIVPEQPAKTKSFSATGTKELIAGLPAELRARIENARPPANPPSSGQETKTPNNPPNAAAAQAKQISLAAAPQPVSQSIAATLLAPASPQVILLPFSQDTGVAAVRHTHDVVLYFDEPRPLDLSALRADPNFEHCVVSMQPAYTQLTIPINQERAVRLSRQVGGWQLSTEPAITDLQPVKLVSAGSELHFLLPSPGKSITAVDPQTGAILLIGTDRAANVATIPSRHSATFTVERSEIGVVVAPFSDRLTLRPITGGFSLFRDDGAGLAMAALATDDKLTLDRTGLTRFLDVQPQSTALLLARIQQQQLAAAQAPPRARLLPRLTLAETLFAVGMIREARSLTHLAMSDEPTSTGSENARLISALLDAADGAQSGRALCDPAFRPSDELQLWRSLIGRCSPSAAVDTAAIRNNLALILSYPDHLRDLAAEYAAPMLLKAATKADLAALERLPTTPGTVVTKTLGAAIGTATSGPLAQLDQLARDRNWKTSSDAILQAFLLRVGLKMISPAAAADGLAARRLDWRATGQEDRVVMQEAELRRQAGQLSTAFALWREAVRRFPNVAAAAQSNIVASLTRLADPRVAATMSPADFVLTITDCARELAGQPQIAAALAPVLADRLEALDLPARATAVLTKVMDTLGTGVDKAKFGGRLAMLLLEQDDPAGARSVLDRSTAPGLPADIDRERRFTLARVDERQGDHDGALKAIADDPTPSALDLRASINEAANRWHDAKLNLAALSDRIPGQGTLEAKQADIAIRLATAASRDGDLALLMKLAHSVNGRFPDPEQQRTFTLMTLPLDRTTPIPEPPATSG